MRTSSNILLPVTGSGSNHWIIQWEHPALQIFDFRQQDPDPHYWSNMMTWSSLSSLLSLMAACLASLFLAMISVIFLLSQLLQLCSYPTYQTRMKLFLHLLSSTLLHLPPLRFHSCRRMLGSNPRTVVNLALIVRCSNHSASLLWLFWAQMVRPRFARCYFRA